MIKSMLTQNIINIRYSNSPNTRDYSEESYQAANGCTNSWKSATTENWHKRYQENMNRGKCGKHASENMSRASWCYNKIINNFE